MQRYVVKRLLLSVLIILGVTLIVFVASRLSGDPVLLIMGDFASDEQIQAKHVELGMDKPVMEQYFLFLKDAVKGDFGQSLRYKKPAVQLILNRLPATLELAFIGFTMGALIGLFLGILSATKPGTWFEWAGKMFALFGISVPGFWLAIMMMLIFGVKLGWLPTSGRGGLSHLVMPVISLSWVTIAGIMRITRSAMLDVLSSEYIKMARVKGLKERIVIWKHALKNALIPITGMIGMLFAMLIGGSVIIEAVFRWPGIGSLMVEAVFARDFPVVQAGVLIISTFVVIVNLIVDVLYGIIDPRIRYD